MQTPMFREPQSMILYMAVEECWKEVALRRLKLYSSTPVLIFYKHVIQIARHRTLSLWVYGVS